MIIIHSCVQISSAVLTVTVVLHEQYHLMNFSSANFKTCETLAKCTLACNCCPPSSFAQALQSRRISIIIHFLVIIVVTHVKCTLCIMIRIFLLARTNETVGEEMNSGANFSLITVLLLWSFIAVAAS